MVKMKVFRANVIVTNGMSAGATGKVLQFDRHARLQWPAMGRNSPVFFLTIIFKTHIF